MQSVTKDGVTIYFPDTIEAGKTQISYSVEPNTGISKTVVFYIMHEKGTSETLTVNVAGG